MHQLNLITIIWIVISYLFIYLIEARIILKTSSSPVKSLKYETTSDFLFGNFFTFLLPQNKCLLF